MSILKTIISQGWALILLTAVAVVGYIDEWPIGVLATILGVTLVIGLAAAVIGAREKELGHLSQRLRELAGYFHRRFMGNSSLSIFTIIDSLFKTENPKLWDWARACDMAQRVFNAWCSSFISRLESDSRSGRFGIHLRNHLYELWLVTNHYQEFIEQFYDIAQKVELPQETTDQYRKFAVEYNTFAEQFRGLISEFKKVARTEIEPPSIKLASELSK